MGAKWPYMTLMTLYLQGDDIQYNVHIYGAHTTVYRMFICDNRPPPPYNIPPPHPPRIQDETF